MKDYNFEFKVLCYNINERKVTFYNIFDNYRVYNETLQAVKDYLKLKYSYRYESYRDDKIYYGYEALKYTIDSVIMNQEWCRCEYEVGCCDWATDNLDKIQKFDCYQQAHENIDLIVHMCIDVVKNKK